MKIKIKKYFELNNKN